MSNNSRQHGIDGLLAIVRGLMVTLRNNFRKKVTIQYGYAPRWSTQATRPIAPRYRGRFVLVREPQTGELRCVGCKMCAQACPGRCIAVTAENKKVATYTIDLEKCLFCGLCVEACPFEALGMSQETMPPLRDRAALHVDLAWLAQPEGAPLPGVLPSTVGHELRPGKKPFVPRVQKVADDEGVKV
ncbi:MAG TPA: NADH-quinone oxidoreductase subunit I [Armatimonadota bacterium]|jgi:NADH-quinone oxidoreductase subunit I